MLPSSFSDHPLAALLAPRTVIVIGATERAGAVGRVVVENLLAAGFEQGPDQRLLLVNPRYTQLFNRACWPDPHAALQASSSETRTTLALITTPADAVPGVLESLGQAGVHQAVVLTAGFAEIGEPGRQRLATVLAAARKHRIRLLGPNCVGLARPKIGLNATFARGQIREGSLALISQSGAIITTLIDWAQLAGVGFSSMVSLGGAADLDFGDFLDALTHDEATDAVLLYLEGVRDARRFMSAARALSRTKPVIAIKVGRQASGAKAAASHSGALAGNDAVMDAALARAGVVRVDTTAELFSAARLLAAAGRSTRAPHTGRLAIVTNGGGPGVIATDRAAQQGLQLAQLSDATMRALNAVLPEHWSHGNPIDIIGDAPPRRFADALNIVAQAPEVDSLLVLFCPQAVTPAEAAAQAVIAAATTTDKPIAAVWGGGATVAAAREQFDAAGVPQFETPEDAIDALAIVERWQRNRASAREAPNERSSRFEPDLPSARAVLDEAIADDRTLLTELESKRLLAAFGIAVPAAILATNADAAVLAASRIGFPVVLKIASRDITHKSDIGGVRLNLLDAEEVRAAANDILNRVRRQAPQARVDGLLVQPFVKIKHGRELIAGVAPDPVFGQVITFGAGGIAVEVMRDTAIALPPLNTRLAQELITRPRIAPLLNAYRDVPSVDKDALNDTLVRLSALICACPWVKELDINPLLAHPSGAIALDARVVIDPQRREAPRREHLAIHPYPEEFEELIALQSGSALLIRPIRPEDAHAEQAFVQALSAQSVQQRFHGAVRELSPAQLERFTQIDYDRELALIACTPAHGIQVAVARYTPTPDPLVAEFAIVIADAWQGQGLGHQLMQRLMLGARRAGYQQLVGRVKADNQAMLALCAALGFDAPVAVPDDDTVDVAFRLTVQADPS